jgi:glycosyltransferase involved in cell wall biosynthesis
VHAERVREHARAHGNVTLLGSQPRSALGDLLAAADVHVLPLRPAVEGLLFPSKLAGMLAAGRPVLFIGSPTGSIARQVLDRGIGWVAGHDPREIRAALAEILGSRPRLEGMGERARRLFEERYSKAPAMAAWTDVVRGVRRRAAVTAA